MTPILPSLSVITVVFNAKEALARTIENVRAQTYPNIEYIIVDGGSTDGTLDVIKGNAKNISQWISEPDQGIYDAMNKGLALARGEYVLFLNAGDEFYNNHTLENIFTKFSNADVYYGETEIINASGEAIGMRRKKAPPELTWKSLQHGMVVCHQSFLIRRNLALEYNLSYRHCADIDWMIRSLKRSAVIHNTHSIISRFQEGGYSKKNKLPSLLERWNVLRTNYGLVSTVIHHAGITFVYLKFRVKSFLTA